MGIIHSGLFLFHLQHPPCKVEKSSIVSSAQIALIGHRYYFWLLKYMKSKPIRHSIVPTERYE